VNARVAATPVEAARQVVVVADQCGALRSPRRHPEAAKVAVAVAEAAVAAAHQAMAEVVAAN